MAGTGRFRGGAVLLAHGDRAPSSDPAQEIAPERLSLPLAQGLGGPGRPLVAAGARVPAGARLTEAAGPLDAPVHAPASGVVEAVVREEGGGRIVLLPDPVKAGAPVPLPVLLERLPEAAGRRAILARAREAGLVLLQGPPVPLDLYLSSDLLPPVRTVILDAAGAGPGRAAARRLLVTEPLTVLGGLVLAVRAAMATEGVVAVSRHRRDAWSAVRASFPGGRGLRSVRVGDRYPIEDPALLARSALGASVVASLSPRAAGVAILDPHTAHALHEAVVLGKPLTHRTVSVASEGGRPVLVRAPFGTPLQELAESYFEKDIRQGMDPTRDNSFKIYIGSPLLGPPPAPPDATLEKSTGSLWIEAAPARPSRASEERPCIRCGDCVRACPVSLHPARLHELVVDGREPEELARAGIGRCLECGLCEYLCPSRIPLLAVLREGLRDALRWDEPS